MNIEQRRPLRKTTKAMGLGASSVKQLLQHGQILEPGRHPADLLRAIRRERTGHVPAMHGADPLKEGGR